jgi:superfamily II DNA or RNA helicase
MDHTRETQLRGAAGSVDLSFPDGNDERNSTPIGRPLQADNLSLRPYQVRSIEMIRESLVAGRRRPVLQLPTGAGKTRIAAGIRRHACRSQEGNFSYGGRP